MKKEILNKLLKACAATVLLVAGTGICKDIFKNESYERVG